MSLVIILTGIPGSGKSTVLAETVKRFPRLKVINYGDVILEEASIQNIDRDMIRKLPIADLQRFGLEAAKRMAAHLPEIVCIDTHALIKTPFGYCPGVPENVIRVLKPNIISMMECPAQHILERRRSDNSRKRDTETLEQIEHHLQISRSYSVACSAIAGALYVPINNQSHPSDAAQQLVDVIHSQIINHRVTENTEKDIK